MKISTNRNGGNLKSWDLKSFSLLKSVDSCCVFFKKKYFHTEISRSLGCYPGKVSTNETEGPKKLFTIEIGRERIDLKKKNIFAIQKFLDFRGKISTNETEGPKKIFTIEIGYTAPRFDSRSRLSIVRES